MASADQHVTSELELYGPDGKVAAFSIIAATEAHFRAHEIGWRPALRSVNAKDAEWTWLDDFMRDELPSSLREAYALVTADGTPQGLMSIDFRLNHVYVERLAIAPWNRPVAGQRRGTRGVGGALLFHAIRRSVAFGNAGRLALHSLEDADTLRFYGERMLMVETRIDKVDGQDMRYFELSIETAAELLGGAP